MTPDLSHASSAISPRLLAFGGVVGPIIYVLTFIIDGWLRPGYSPLSEMISELGTSEPNPWIMGTAFVLNGLLLIAFAIGFEQAMSRVISRGWLRFSTMLLVLIGVGWTSAGLFNETIPKGATPTLRVVLHDAAFLTIFISTIVMSFILGRQLLKAPTWRGYGWYTIITGFATLGLMATLFYTANQEPQIVGLVNRILVVVALAWDVVMAMRIIVMNREIEPQNLATNSNQRPNTSSG